MKASLDVEAKVTGGTYTINSNAHLSREIAQREARENFREMVSKAVMKIQTETRKLTTRRVTTDSTETNLHEFNNTASPLPQVAKYFYVNQVEKGQVFSHGLRLMLDILIPSPASLFLELEERKSKQASGLEEPKRPNLSPSDFDPEIFPGYEGDNSYRELWEFLMETYEISEFPEPPPDMKPPYPDQYTGTLYKDQSDTIDVPAGYRAVNLYVNDANVVDDFWDAAVADKVRMVLYYGNSNVEQNLQDETTGPLYLGVNGPTTLKFTATGHHIKDGDSWIRGRVSFEPIKQDYTTWQEDAFATIMAKFEVDMAEYERLLAEHNMRFREERKLMHPFTAEEHIRTQMKQASIFMMCDDFGDEVMNMKAEPCGYPTVFRGKAKEATSRWYFFDRAFDWTQAGRLCAGANPMFAGDGRRCSKISSDG